MKPLFFFKIVIDMQQVVTLTQSKVLQGGVGQEWGKTKPLAPAPAHPIAIPGYGSPSPPPLVTVCMCVYIYTYIFCCLSL